MLKDESNKNCERWKTTEDPHIRQPMPISFVSLQNKNHVNKEGEGQREDHNEDEAQDVSTRDGHILVEELQAPIVETGNPSSDPSCNIFNATPTLLFHSLNATTTLLCHDLDQVINL
mmetsp:Transcript_66352/g.126413  ORF Transcript_66352/g.126413 Transcript_66352/m.126413 type:complete len:117 (+) Transcript_66352:2387-2737(+)